MQVSRWYATGLLAYILRLNYHLYAAVLLLVHHLVPPGYIGEGYGVCAYKARVYDAVQNHFEQLRREPLHWRLPRAYRYRPVHHRAEWDLIDEPGIVPDNRQRAAIADRSHG